MHAETQKDRLLTAILFHSPANGFDAVHDVLTCLACLAGQHCKALGCMPQAFQHACLLLVMSVLVCLRALCLGYEKIPELLV